VSAYQQQSTNRKYVGDRVRFLIEQGYSVTQDEFAKAMGVSRLTVSQLISGNRRVTANVAKRLERVTCDSAATWMVRQSTADLAATKIEHIRRPKWLR
jgi:addiction module HigA family antidote